uniref:Protein kinase domain-containing protein n=1 Tax=Oryza punctata TaxID=4537 RepID=A0A0E0JVK9_ORYPU
MSAKRRAAGPTHESALLESKEFSYRGLKHITNNFSQQVGKGGFGAVFLGYLENGNPVAVKVRSESSSQGSEEFLVEVLVIFNLKKFFGVVLLELITGRPPVVPIDESVSIHIGEFVHQSLDHGSIESIVDARMGGRGNDINSVWKVADLALHCKQEVSRERPTMTEVVAQLKESLELGSHWR